MFDNIKFTDLISSFSALVGAITGLVMAWLAYKTYLKTPEQEDRVEAGTDEDSTASSPKEVTIFQTSKQTTVLRIEDNQLLCEIKDDRHGRGGRQWRLNSAICKDIVKKRRIHANPNYKPRTGLVTIGPKKNWLYSKNLFIDHAMLEDEIYALLETIE